MYVRRLSAIDRRSGKDRRKANSFAHLSYRVADRKYTEERRSEVDRRMVGLRANQTRVSFRRTTKRGSRIDLRLSESGNQRNYVLSLW